MDSLISSGNLEEYASKNKSYYSIKGVVEKGDSRGSKIGFPTANIKLLPEEDLPKGVYAVLVRHENKILKGVANIGLAPTFDRKKILAEVHIFDFSEMLYGKHLEIFLVSFIRPEKKFESVSELIDQIKQDSEAAKSILSSYDPSMVGP